MMPKSRPTAFEDSELRDSFATCKGLARFISAKILVRTNVCLPRARYSWMC